MKFFVPKIDHPFTVRGTTIRPDDTPEQYLQELARITLDEMFQLVGVLTTDGILLECNRAALVAGGLTRDDVIGKPFWETYWWTCSPKTQEDLRNAIARAAKGEFVRYDTEVYGRKGGAETMTMDFTLLPVMDEKGRIVFLLPEGRDITEKKAYEREIARQREELAKLDVLKTQFFANVSHEFRTPLTLMLGPLEDVLARAGEVPSAQRERLQVVHRNSLRLLKLVNTLLDFSRIEAGRIQASYHATDLAAVTAELASNFRSACEKAGLRLIVECFPLAEPVYVDRDMWEKIVLNLVSNAFKFTLEGEIEVRLKAVDDEAFLTVRDTGVGIPSEELPRMFERFHRIEHSRGRTYEGSGIGLALVQELVKLHAGTVRVDSVLGEGSTFTVTVPFGTKHLDPDRIGRASELASTVIASSAFVEEALRWLPAGVNAETEEVFAPLPAAPGPDIPGQQPDTQRVRIVWADDNADMREYVSRLLGASGRFDVEAVADGQAALDAARANPPELILSDVMMPRLDGFGLLSALRADPQLREIPVILLSARAGEESRIEGVQAGADDYLIKPFSARELIARIETHVKMSRMRRQATHALRESEERVREMNAELGKRVTDLKNSEQRQQLLMNELDHRSNNLLAVVQTIVSRSLSGTRSLAEARDALTQRIHALARSQALLVNGAFEGASLTDIIRLEFEAFSDRVRAVGPDVMLNSKAAQNFALLVHELATNATKYGALSTPEGRIAINWSIEGVEAEKKFSFRWLERDGPRVTKPTRRGFGRILIEKAATQEFAAEPKISFDPEGLTYEIEAPLSVVSGGGITSLREASAPIREQSSRTAERTTGRQDSAH